MSEMNTDTREVYDWLRAAEPYFTNACYLAKDVEVSLELSCLFVRVWDKVHAQSLQWEVIQNTNVGPNLENVNWNRLAANHRL